MIDDGRDKRGIALDDILARMGELEAKVSALQEAVRGYEKVHTLASERLYGEALETHMALRARPVVAEALSKEAKP